MPQRFYNAANTKTLSYMHCGTLVPPNTHPFMCQKCCMGGLCGSFGPWKSIGGTRAIFYESGQDWALMTTLWWP